MVYSHYNEGAQSVASCKFTVTTINLTTSIPNILSLYIAFKVFWDQSPNNNFGNQQVEKTFNNLVEHITLYHQGARGSVPWQVFIDQVKDEVSA